MKDKISFAVLSSDPARRDRVAEALAATGAIRVVATADRPEELEATLQSAARVCVYVDLTGDAEKGLGWIEALSEPRPHVIAGGPEDPQVILRAMRAGALAYFPHHELDGELLRIATRLQELAAAEAPAAAGQVLAVLGAKGGVGCTTVACELAASLAKLGGRVAVVDGKAYFGDVALHFDVRPGYTLADVARADDLDGTFLATVAHRHEASGVHVVAAPADPEEADGIEASHVERSVELLRSEFDWVVVDLPRITDEATLQVVEKADQVVLVSTRDLGSLVRAKQHVQLLDQLGVAEEKRHIVANRATRPGLLSEGDPLEALGLEAVAYVPEDADAIEASLAAGRPASGQSGNKVGPVFGDLAARAYEWCDVEREEVETPEEPEGLKDRLSAAIGGRVTGIVEELRCRLASA